jgi:glucose-6-phosphate isomerase
MRWLHDTAMMQARVLANTQQVELTQQLNALASHPLITVLDGLDDLADARGIAKRFRSSSDVTVVIGTGGASLGAQALVAAASERARLIFLDNIDPLTVESLFVRAGLLRVNREALPRRLRACWRWCRRMRRNLCCLS